MDNIETKNETEDNVVSLFGAKSKNEKQAKSTNSDSSEISDEIAFEEAMKRNEENRRRMMKERNNANKGVLKSYRIKH
jgi:hypothetical protein